jgi:RNase P subunit RPR2
MKPSSIEPVLAFSDAYRQGRCRRCGGLLVPEFFPELDTRSSETTAERCVQCGDVVDRLIILNRSHRPVVSDPKRGVEQWQL